MRVPNAGQPLFERRIVREGKALAERMLAGYDVTANGTFVRSGSSNRPSIAALMDMLLPALPRHKLSASHVRIWK
ncbi:MAG: hypothetical protein KIT02_04785 [Devosia sp.]|uniref:hypothetical protein n=1 Tax=Devosia sp. TaxID=1871048 RepID=UPI0024CC0068|nr:hypothetical protein [Devosia sp.]UYO00536.1 MAG: hypothetical protein KIT02_04785 [Devosia sp.]